MKIFLIALGCLLFASCSNNDNTSSASQVVISGTWRVSLFTNNGTNETIDFSGYTFSFITGGTITVVKNGVSLSGTWSVNTSSNKFSIDLGAKTDVNKPLGELTDDWKIISVTETVIQLQDDNTSNNEKLTFSKN